jgi:hypothetical protein
MAVQARAQSLSPEVIATDGNFYSSSNASLSWTLGEVATETYTSTNNHLTQGFQQPEVIITSVDEAAAGVSVSIYPNPSAGMLSIKISSAETRTLDMQVLDMSGKLISKREEAMSKGDQTVSIDLTHLAAGQYMLQVTDTKANTRSTYTIQKNN